MISATSREAAFQDGLAQRPRNMCLREPAGYLGALTECEAIPYRCQRSTPSHVIVIAAIVLFLRLESVNPDQFAILSDLKFEARNIIEIDFDGVDRYVAPSVSFGFFCHTVSFFHFYRFPHGLWKRIQG